MGLSFSHLVSASDITRQDVSFLDERAKNEMEEAIERGSNLLKGKLIGLFLLDKSFRTRSSFEAATLRLEGKVMKESDKDCLSIEKGETFPDMARVAAGYMDAMVMRHDEAAEFGAAAKEAGLPFINGGNGSREHPTQALLDLYTIEQQCHRIDGLHVAMVGDLERGRTVHSLAKLLSLYDDIRLTFATPDTLRMPVYVKNLLEQRNVPYEEVDTLEPALEADVLYMTRTQHERPSNGGLSKEEQKEFRLTGDHVRGKKIVVMHPLPRNAEIAPDVDSLPNAVYFKQAHNGVPVRMALLATMLGK